MYFPVCPLTEIGGDFFKEILYDYLFCRVISRSKKEYEKRPSEGDLSRLREFLKTNERVIIGLGNRIGNFWVPAREDTASHPETLHEVIA